MIIELKDGTSYDLGKNGNIEIKQFERLPGHTYLKFVLLTGEIIRLSTLEVKIISD